MRTTARRPYGFTQLELLTILALIALLVSLTTPAILAARQSASQHNCKNHLKQIGLAMHDYHEVHGIFPPGWTTYSLAADIRPAYGWQSMLLPFVEQGKVYDQLDFEDVKFDYERLRREMSIYRCPSDPTPNSNPFRGGFGTSNYSLSSGNQLSPRWAYGSQTQHWPGLADSISYRELFVDMRGIGRGNGAARIRDIFDGTSNTIMIGERASFTGAGIWVGVRDNQYEDDVITNCAPGNTINKGRISFSSHHKGGANFVLADGSVHFINENIDSAAKFGEFGIYQALGGISDGKEVDEF